MWASLIVADFINELVAFNTFKKLNNIDKKIEIKDIIVFILLAMISALLIITVKSSLNFFIKLFCVMYGFKYLTQNSLPKSIITIIVIYIILAISEMIYALVILGFINIDANSVNNVPHMILISNIGIIMIFKIIFTIPQVFKFSKSIVKWYYEKYISNSIIVLLITMFPIYFFLIKNINFGMKTIDYIVNTIFIICIILFIIIYFKQNEDKNKIIRKYDNLLDYAKTYEQEVIEKSKWQHEYENQLIIIKEKISKTNKMAHRYIDELLKNKPVDINSQWLGKLSRFPDIGIKGLLCYKIGQMQNKGINVFVDVTNDFKINKNICQLLEENLQDISRILGVYIDNAMEASAESTSKYLIFEVDYINNKLIFQISNTYSYNLELQKIGEDKYSTKGKGHGYGLSLVKDIMEKNSLLSEEREINGIYYVQKLIINIKNKSY